ncbi:MAG: hypothetical protein WAL52_09585 [Candidatus Sulfotelmatobacter sp.]
MCGALLVLAAACTARDRRLSTGDSTPPAVLEIHLSDLGYQPAPETNYPGNGIPRDLTILNDDYKQRLTFIDDKMFVAYQSHYPPQIEQGGSSQRRSMEAFFVSAQTGALISRKSWPTVQRRWLNERWDTQARIMAVQGGFLVHASDSLSLYSAEIEPKGKLVLEGGPRWAVTVAPLGRTIHLQRIQDDNRAEGEWFDSDTLAKLSTQHETAGVTSASDHAVVNKLTHCVQLETVGETPRSLNCADQPHLGLPLFLSDSEVLSVYGKGFAVFSTSGEKQWSREAPDARPVANHKRSLNGNRFAILIRGPIIFDRVDLAEEQSAILVYDVSARTQVFHLTLSHVAGHIDFDLSPDGSAAAVLVGETVRLYKIPSS